MKTLIMKFGGSAIGTVAALTQALSITMHESKKWDHLILVASALDGVTDMLLEAAQLAQISNERGYRRIIATLRTRHLALIDDLPLGTQERSTLHADIDRLLFEIIDECQNIANKPSAALTPEITDRVIGVGERLSARIIAALLRQNNLRGVAIDGSDIIVTDDVHGNATPIMNLTRQRISNNLVPMLGRQIIPVVSGFIGATVDGRLTTIGRGGSDYTASVLAASFDVAEVWIWSDVDGMMSADPRSIREACAIEQMSYTEVAELAYFGARILHARMIYPLQEAQIPLRIRNVYKPQQPGTLVSMQSKSNGVIKAVTTIPAIGLTANRSGSLSNITKLVDETLYEASGTHADVMISSQSSARSFLCFIMPTNAGGLDAVTNIHETLSQRLNDLRDSADWDVEPLAVVTAIGENLDEFQNTAATILRELEDIYIIGLTQGPSRCSLSIIVRPDDADATLRHIHRLALNTG